MAISIEFKDKYVYFGPEAGLHTQGEARAEVYDVTGPRYHDGHDLSAMTWYVRASHPDYMTIINKKLVTASNIFRFTMSTDVQAIKCLTGSDAEVLEFIVKPNSPATKVRIKDLGLPEDTIIGGIVRGDKVFIAVGNMELSAYDRVVVFAMPASISKIGYFFN